LSNNTIHGQLIKDTMLCWCSRAWWKRQGKGGACLLCLRNTNLSSANLRNTNLSSANLRNTNLSGVNLAQVYLTGVVLFLRQEAQTRLKSGGVHGILTGLYLLHVYLHLD